MEMKYKILDSKINKLTLSQNRHHDNGLKIYPRVVNNTNIAFSNEEITLMNKFLKCNLPCNNKYWLSPDIYRIVYKIKVVLLADV